MQYQVVCNDSRYYVQGLGKYDNGELLIYRYPEGDIDTIMKDQDMMHGALYDLYQVHDDLKDGDTFVTEFGNFECQGIHVIKQA